jgi:hypothetical protein
MYESKGGNVKFCVVNVSGGVPSAIALERAIAVFGRKRDCEWFTSSSCEVATSPFRS